MAERVKDQSTQLKRIAAAHFIKALWPVEFKEQSQGNLLGLNEGLRNGKGAIGLVPHFSKGDFLTILGGLLTSSDEVLKRAILIPIAAHQRPKYLDWICTFTDVNLATIITLDTKHKEKELRAKGKPVPWQKLDPEEAVKSYFDRAALTLKEGGVVILAPQGGRRNLLTPFKGGPLTRLEKQTQQMGVDNLAYFAIGLEILGTTDYSKLQGLNIRSKYCVTLGEVTERKNIEGNIDTWGYQQMLKLAPPAYRPQGHV